MYGFQKYVRTLKTEYKNLLMKTEQRAGYAAEQA